MRKLIRCDKAAWIVYKRQITWIKNFNGISYVYKKGLLEKSREDKRMIDKCC
jgi:hypothetical protein